MIKKYSLVLTAMLCPFFYGFGQIVAWEMAGNTGNEIAVNATTLNPNLNISTINRGSGINPTNLNDAFSSNNFTLNGTQASALANNDYLQFQISPLSGYQVSLNSLDVTLRRSNTGPNTYIWRYSTDGVNFNNIGAPISLPNSGNGITQTQINLSIIPELQNVPFGTDITFRLYTWGATNFNGTFAIGRLSGNDLSIGGIVTPITACATTTTWTAGGWSSPPTANKLAIIDFPYNTNVDGSFEACSLIINAGNTLAISNSTYINVVNNVTNYGTIDIQAEGSFIQQGDGASAGTFTNSGAGIANVAKTTAVFDSSISEINYTYWSSPINDPSNPGFGENIAAVFPSPVGNRRYYFMAQNYIDSFFETGNNNDNSTLGQDDIDDNFNDWQSASAAMEVGRGYAVTASGLPPSPGIFTDNSTVFSGALNTGDITVTLYKNNNEINDNNWNFIGNPYPSAISVDDFFLANAAVDDVNIDPSQNPDGLTEGAIFLWSQSVAPDAGNNGNENVNFAQSDYAIINRATATAGTSGITPSRYIPSGQGFFVAFTENLSSPINSVTSGNVIFTNSMRSTGNNTQFFDANNSTQEETNNLIVDNNILWLNLTSDNGVFSQIAVAYVNGATDSYDGWSFDTPRNLSTGTYATLYSIIDSSDRQFAIQGKSPQSLTLNEIIPIGFDTSIDKATLYKFSIAQLEGSFLGQNDIFIKDKLFNKIHNLKESDYSFTSEVGEFKDRFEIVFTRETLSSNEAKFDDNSLQIIELPNGDVQFKLSSSFEMKSIEIVDLLGRTLYKLDVQGNSQTFSLNNLSQATYLAKVKLSNGKLITKKAMKRN